MYKHWFLHVYNYIRNIETKKFKNELTQKMFNAYIYIFKLYVKLFKILKKYI